MSEILFLMAVRNRKENALKSLASIAKSGLGKEFDFLIVQDIDKNNIEEEDLEKFWNKLGKIELANVKVGGFFNKTLLLNYGIRNSKQKFIVQQDADIIFSKNFLITLKKICETEENFKKFIFVAPYVEMEDMKNPAINKQTEIRKKGDYVSDTLILYRPLVEEVRGYDEQIKMWNEEKDLLGRIRAKFRINIFNLGNQGIFNQHLTHGNELRVGDIFVNDDNVELSNKNLIRGNFVANDENWGKINGSNSTKK